ncbi:UNVERIFIED_CONTAM: hypothetical protein PYX00_001252 [Menopon gallinae]|uniref:Uncharacterized protein n=1 Tax=Menopon gallinae TaxID=328185 RepID=A0AAW2IC05_9NEOP
MEYHSPLSYNFKLKESLLKQEEKQNDSKNQSLPNYISLNSDGHAKSSFPFETSNKRRNSHFDGSGNYESDQRGKWNSPNQRNRKGCNVADYYHPSMVEDPWKELMEKYSGS